MLSNLGLQDSQNQKMGWSYPELSIQDLMKLIKNYIDMLMLASGYQSTGRLANWDSNNIKRSFQWALFLENVSDAFPNFDSLLCFEEIVRLQVSLFQSTVIAENFCVDITRFEQITRCCERNLKEKMMTPMVITSVFIGLTLSILV